MIEQAELESQFREATSLRDLKDFHAAKAILERLARERPNELAVLLVLGDVLTDLDDYPAAERAFRTATALQPRHEIASVALFFALAHQRRDEEAFAEARRYLMLRPDSRRYKEILDEMDSKLPTEG